MSKARNLAVLGVPVGGRSVQWLHEIMFPEHIRNVFALLSTFKVLRLPRLTFEGDRYHYCPVYYPDWQTRAFWLGLGIRYSGRVHETVEESLSAIGLIESGDLNASTKRDILRVPHLPIFHYEGLRTDVARYFKHMNYARLQAGLEPLLEYFHITLCNPVYWRTTD